MISDTGQFHTARHRPRYWRRLVIIAFALVGAAAGVQYFWFSRSVGSGPAGPAVSMQAYDHVWTTQKVVLLGVGDSVTAGYGASKGHSYFKRLIANPEDESADMRGICLSKVLPNLQTRNVAVSGSTSLQHAAVLDRLEPFAPEVFGLVVMSTGGNDIIHDYGRSSPREGAIYGATLEQAQPWIALFEQRLDGMVKRLTACFPGGSQIFLANIYDPTDGIGDCQSAGLPPWPDVLKIVAAYNQVIARCTERHVFVHLVNIHDEFLGHGIHCAQFWQQHYRTGDPHYWYFHNLEDPNNRGYDAIRRLFLNEIVGLESRLGSAAAIQTQTLHDGVDDDMFDDDID